jgi:hypothetical protein
MMIADVIVQIPGWIPCEQLEPWSWRWVLQMCYLSPDVNALAVSVVVSATAAVGLNLWMRRRSV